jgi:hypothetical protein
MTVLTEYARAWWDLYRWLYRACPPWRWLLAAGSAWVPLPGSPLNQSPLRSMIKEMRA